MYPTLRVTQQEQYLSLRLITQAFFWQTSYQRAPGPVGLRGQRLYNGKIMNEDDAYQKALPG